MSQVHQSPVLLGAPPPIEIDFEEEAEKDSFKASHYEPSAWGSMYHQLQHREAMGAGSAGPGKSLCLLMDPMQRIMVDHWRCLGEIPDAYASPEMVRLVKRFPLQWGESSGWALHLRRAFPMLSQTIARSMRIFPQFDPDAKYDKNEYTWHFRSGYRLQFGHCLNRDDWQKYDSAQFDWIGYDELVQFDEEQYHNINTRLRSSDPIHSKWLKIRSMSNPLRRIEEAADITVRDPQWVRRRFVDPYPDGGVTLRKALKRVSDSTTVYRDRIYLRATLYDNPDPAFVKQYEEELLDKPQHIRQAMLYGNWYVTPGSYFGDDWNPNLHIVPPFRVPDDWPRFRMMDWGFKTQGVVLWAAMDPDGNLYIEREFNFRHMEAIEVAKQIRKIETDMGLWVGGVSAITGPADTQLWEQRGESGKSKADEMAAIGVGWVCADKKNRQRNAERILQRLCDHKNGTRQPGLMFFNGSTKKCVQTIPMIQADPNNSEEPLKGGDDHWWEALGYGVAFASHGPKGIPRRRRKPTDGAYKRLSSEEPSGRQIAYGVYR
ncbi:MAG: terminase family protein [Nitrospira sp.]|nr:terminase family protein [Nitrospira sp.]